MADQALLDDEPMLRRFAARRREAAEATALARGPLGERTWDQVARMLSRANEELARCDEAWLDLSAASLEMVAERGDLAQLALVWGPSVRAACRFRGPDSDTVTRMRACRRSVRTPPRATRRVDDAVRRLRDQAYRAGRTSTASRGQVWRLAELYGKYLLGEEMAAHLTRVVGWYADTPERVAVARRAAGLCLDVGEVERGREFYEIYYAAEVPALAERADVLSRTMLAARRQQLADYHLLNGEPARAETLLREAIEPLAELLGAASARRDIAILDELHGRCLATLADSLLVQGRWAHAHDAYWAAYRQADHGRARSDRDAARRRFTAAVYTSRKWLPYD